MAQFVTLTDVDGLILKINPVDVVSIYPKPSNPAITVIRLADNSTFLSNQTVVVLQVMFTVTDTVAIDAASLTALENTTIQNAAGAAAVNIQDGGNSITVDALNLDIRDLSFVSDSVNVSGSFVTMDIANASTASAPNRIVTGAAAVILAANGLRRSFTIQNTGTATVKITFGATNPTTTVYHFALAPGSVADDGKGSFYVDDQWDGTVRAFSDTPSSVVIMEIT